MRLHANMTYQVHWIRSELFRNRRLLNLDFKIAVLLMIIRRVLYLTQHVISPKVSRSAPSIEAKVSVSADKC